MKITPSIADKHRAEPFRIKVVEPIKMTTLPEREKILKTAYYNTFMIRSEDVFIDLLTDSGTSAMSDNQWAGMMLGDESYAMCRNYFSLKSVVKKLFGFDKFVPTHQGRAAEHILFSCTVDKTKVIPNNMHFDTTRANIEDHGGLALNLVNSDAFDTQKIKPFKGNMDVEKLETAIKKYGAKNIPLVMLTVTNNSGGGQPVSMSNIREVSRVSRKNGIPFFLDACRFAENAYFIKTREPGYANKDIRAIVREMFSYSDGFTMSAKKDGIVNIGGLLAVRNDKLFTRIKERLIINEGFITYGDLAGRDLEALARGFMEATEYEYLKYRINQVKYLGDCLMARGIPIIRPTGGHAVYMDAKGIFPKIPQKLFPAQALTIELYREAGIRAVEIGSVMFAAKDRKTGVVKYPELELVRLAIPRRVYTDNHMNVVAEATGQIMKRRNKIKGCRIVWEPPTLRHFTARFAPVK
ncbi:MAG: tryptophanase [Planctomycetota bacterium]